MTNQVKTYPIPIDQIAPLHISYHRKSCLAGRGRNGVYQAAFLG